MCGLAGFVGVPHAARSALARALAEGIDRRGKHGAGYVAIDAGQLRHARALGTWKDASAEFLAGVPGDVALLHSRYATCGQRTIDEVHPFEVVRAERTLYVAHNGMIDNARESAEAHGRAYSVDSIELAELLADVATEEIATLEGYGTLAWVEDGRLYVVRMTDDAEAYIAACVGGGTVLGSTERIVDDALRAAGLAKMHYYKLDVGEVYELRGDSLYRTHHARVTLADRYVATRWEDFRSFASVGERWWERGSAFDFDDDDDAESVALWEAEELTYEAIDRGENPKRDPEILAKLRVGCGMLDDEAELTIDEWAEEYFRDLLTERDDDDERKMVAQ